jgi:PAS domain S-box-containing protein
MLDPFKREALELQTILDTMADGVFVLDPNRRIQRWNAAMTRMTGFTEQEAVGSECGLLRRSDPAGDQGLLRCDLFAEGQVDRREITIETKAGALLPVLASARVMRGPGGEPLGAVVTMTDLSTLRDLELEMDRLRQVAGERYHFHNIVGKSQQMREVFGLIEMAASSQVSVLITGETGTGKELVAKAVHYAGDRREGPLVTVNCSALSESLLESELFGHVRGAFTGAVKDRPGRFERAQGGTIFLDEIGEITPLVQVKLLRVLQEREFERVGDSTPRSVDVRVIAATNRDLRQRVREGSFREDLYYRLKVFPIHLPPLRTRKEDIEPLIRQFIDKYNGETGKRIEGVSSEAMRIIMDYCWPGNVRELENAIEHAFVTCPGEYIGPFDLPIEIRRVELKQEVCGERADESGVSASAPWPARSGPTAPPLRRFGRTKEDLEAVLAESGWNKAEAARRLGITRTSVWRRMKKLGIPLDPPAAG